MRNAKTFLSAALVAALVAAAAPAAAQTGRIGGTIKDAQGQVLKGATVTAENPSASPSSFTATTDDRGRFSIIGLRSGTWKITASAPGFSPNGGSLPIRTIGAPNPPLDIVLAAGPSGPAGALAGVNTKELQGELAKAEEMLKAAILEELNELPEDQLVMLKLTLPEQDDCYAACISHPNVVRVVALSGGYTRDEANSRLRRNHGIVASFSRALVEGLTAQQSAAEFNALLDAYVQGIFEASNT